MKTHEQMLKALVKSLTPEEAMYLCIALRKLSGDQIEFELPEDVTFKIAKHIEK